MILSIQYLRAVAACAVAAFHIGLVFGWNFDIGNAGVDLFFVISGFVMWLITHDRNISIGRFLFDRLSRIAPLYWVMTLFLFMFILIKPNFFPLERGTDIGHVIRSMIFLPHISHSGNGFPLLIQGWTLNYEIFFYSILALCITITKKYRIIYLTLAGVVLVVLGNITTDQNIVLKTYTSDLIMEFIAGAWLCWFWVSGKFGIGAALFALAILFYSAIVRNFGINLVEQRVNVFGSGSVILTWLMLYLDNNKLIPKVNLLKLVGDASYSLYLTHGFMISILSVVLDKINMPRSGLLLFFAFVGVSIAVAVLCYLALERPMTAFLRKAGSRYSSMPAFRPHHSLGGTMNPEMSAVAARANPHPGGRPSRDA